MSLSAYLKGSSQFSQQFKLMLKNIIPSREDFVSSLGYKPFSTEVPLLVPNCIQDKEMSSWIIGTAFDYLARFSIARKLRKTDGVFDMLCCGKTVKMFRPFSKDKYDKMVNSLSNYNVPFREIAENDIELLRLNYDKALNSVKDFIQGNIDDIIYECVFFARLEQHYRREYIFEKLSDFYSKVPFDIYEEIVEIYVIFNKVFLPTLNSNSVVIYNPDFGGATYLMGGADADIYIDGCLYDFKTSHKAGYNWLNSAQIVSYFYLNLLNLDLFKTQTKLNGHNITELGIYRARYGEIIKCILDDKFYNEYYEIFKKFVMTNFPKERLEYAMRRGRLS